MTGTRTRAYTVRLAAGLGMIEETGILLDLWHDGMDTSALTRAARESGRFPSMSASRLANLVSDGFALRYLVDNAAPARVLKAFGPVLARRAWEQLLFRYTCCAHPILADFVCDVYWPAYAASRPTIDNAEALAFVSRANQEGKTTTPWADSTIRRAAGYLTGCCADFGLLERGTRRVRRILPYRLEPQVAVVLAYDLRRAGRGDNALVADPDWALFGLEPDDVLAELKRMARQGLVIVQTAGSAVRIGWQHTTMEEVRDALAHDAF